MQDHIIPLIRKLVGNLWNRRFQQALKKARQHESPDTYRKGYSEGYWDGIADMASVIANPGDLSPHQGNLPVAEA